MTPLLNHLQDELINAKLPGFSREGLTIYITEARPAYVAPFDPDQRLPPDSPITLEFSPPASLVINPFAGDLIDLTLVLNLILDDLAPASRGDDKRLRISAEVLDDKTSVVVIALTLRERIRYIPAADGNLTINGTHYKREAPQPLPQPQPLNEIRHVG